MLSDTKTRSESSARPRRTTLAIAALVGLAAPACATFDAPPAISLVGEKEGLLADPAAPIVVRFSEKIDPATLHLKLARYVTDDEGNLGDEDEDPETALETFFRHDPRYEEGGHSSLDASGLELRILLDAPLPVGPRLALLVEPGLASPAGGDATHTRRRLLFGYSFDLECGQPADALPSGTYFFLADVSEPIATQVQLFAVLRIDASNGNVVGQYTNADRSPDPNRCGLTCMSTEACRSGADPECILPSTKAGSPDEFPDFVPNAEPPTGYSFTDTGCVKEQKGGSAVLVMAPVDVAVASPPVTLRNVHLVASFAPDKTGKLEATGSFSADAVLLGDQLSGVGKGDLTAVFVPEGQAPPGIPSPPPSSNGDPQQP